MSNAASVVVEQEWQRAHRELSRLAKEQAAHDYEEARWLVAAVRGRVDLQLGFASISEYLERLFGYSPRLAQEKVRVAQALEELGEMALCLRDGVLHWSAVRLLSRVATRETEGEWIDAARGKSMRELERLTAGRASGDRPADRVRPELVAEIIHAEVMPETMALWREALMAVKKEAGEALSEDEAIRAIARIVLEGPADPGRATHQIVITRCADCGRLSQRGCGEDHAVGEHVFAAASCDAQVIDIREGPAHATQEIPPAVRRFVLHRDGGRCVVRGCRAAGYLDVHHLRLKSEGGTRHPDLLATLCSTHHAQVHEGRLIIDGTASAGLVFRHADGTSYGAEVDANTAAALSEAFEGLLALGFKQGESKKALDHVREQRSIDSAPAALKSALRYLRATP